MAYDKRKPEYNQPEWRRNRKLALQRDNHTCQQCGKPGNQVDHIKRYTQGGTHQLENLRTLCHPCHAHRTAQDSHENRARKQHPKEPHPGLKTANQTQKQPTIQSTTADRHRPVSPTHPVPLQAHPAPRKPHTTR